MHSLKNLSDEIIVLFDGKVSENDISYKIAKKFTNKIFMNKENVYNFNSSKLRNKLLRLGRVHEGTHFIWLDADEAISKTFSENGKDLLQKMIPGEKFL